MNPTMTRAAPMLIAALLAAPAWAAPPPHAAMPASAAASMPARKAPRPPVQLVDINSASVKQLKTLPGIGDAEAQKIIAHRPYLTKTELVTKGVLPTGPFLSLKRQVVAMPPKKKPAAKGQP